MMQSKQALQRIILTRMIGVLCGMGGAITIAAIAPTAAHAYVSRVDVVVDVQAGETYETFLRRAESIARAAAQRSLDRDILISEVYVIVVGQKNGGSVQVLSLQASRQQWRSRPDARRWATYYPSASVLLGFGRSPSSNATSPASLPPSPTVLQPSPSSPTSPSSPASPTSPSPDFSKNPPVRSPIRPIPPLVPGSTPLPPQ